MSSNEKKRTLEDVIPSEESVFKSRMRATSIDENVENANAKTSSESSSESPEEIRPEEHTCKETDSVKLNSKRQENVLSWDDYFMSVAFLSSMRSKDPSTQVGACIVNRDRRIVGIGYNGFPKGCSDDELPWARTFDEGGSELDTKYPYVCHAEMNAILNKNSADVQGCSIYVGLFPCNECAKMIIQSGIEEVIYLSDKYSTSNSMIASRRLLQMAKVKMRQHIPVCRSVNISFPPNL
jgi:dCMP deaminase